jgi:hypothetical protein
MTSHESSALGSATTSSSSSSAERPAATINVSAGTPLRETRAAFLSLQHRDFALMKMARAAMTTLRPALKLAA